MITITNIIIIFIITIFIIFVFVVLIITIFYFLKIDIINSHIVTQVVKLNKLKKS